MGNPRLRGGRLFEYDRMPLALRQQPDRFSRAHLRTLQRRVQQWRGIMTDRLVHAASEAKLPDPGGMPEMALTAGDPKC